ncbi:hypothetical protein AWC38_SpisGene2196 [Stylophora pistillata]|uniref:Uncharacterized protein n=1 Tax=Stylophora pistillata TaxID=50429 RepID=A0A2B4SUZ7_STYPI|nr:hypothetical protein AWC38_SpisGene2196 [Stylophora pistillata]
MIANNGRNVIKSPLNIKNRTNRFSSNVKLSLVYYCGEWGHFELRSFACTPGNCKGNKKLAVVVVIEVYRLAVVIRQKYSIDEHK